MTVSTRPLAETQKIEAYPVSEHARMGTLPRHFGLRMAITEDTVYAFMRQFAEAYGGGYWNFYELSNGGFYMAPEMPSVQFCVPTNGFEGQLSADAAGIAVCLFTYSHLSFQFPNDALFSRHFHRLREFAFRHAEAGQILAAID